MAKDEETQQKVKKWHGKNASGGSSAIYGLGIIGVAIYYLQHATTFWLGILGILKAVFWPAVLLYKIFELLKL